MKKRIISLIMSFFIIITVIPSFFASAMTILTNYSATINGVKVTKDSYSGQKNCWKYANGIYKIIWGCNFTSDFTGNEKTDYNMLRDMTGENRKITLENTKKYITAAPLGAVIRVCRTNSTAYSDGSDGHNLILAGKDSGGYYFFEDWGAGNSGYDAVATYYTFSEFASFFPNSKQYYYFKYIKWPKAGTFTFDYYVKFDANGGSGAPAKQGKSKKTDISISTTIPTRQGYACCGWATAKDATAPEYYADSKFDLDKNITLYAVWKAAANLGNGFYAKIRNASLSKYLTTESDDNVASYSGNNKYNQLWYFKKQSDGSYKVKNKKNGCNLSITYAVATAGGNVKTYSENSTPAQNWFFVKSGSKYLLYSKCTDKVLGINNASKNNGTNVSTNINEAKGYQLFSVVKDITSPVVSNVKISGVNYQSFKVSGTIIDNKAFKSATIKSYTTENGDDDAVTSNLTIGADGTFSYKVNRSEHKYDYGEYTFKITAYDSSYNYSTYTSKSSIPASYSPKAIVESDKKFYAIYDISISFEKAKAYAAGLGGHLATITSEQEQQTIFDAINENGKKDLYWLGFYDDDKNNKFDWITGEKIAYRNWAKGEPSNKSEQYAFMYRKAISTANAGQWADIGNYASASKTSPYYITKYGFVVEYESVPAPVLCGASTQANGIEISLSKSEIATGYEIYRRLSTATQYVKIADISNEGALKYLDTKVANGSTYYYGVKAVRNTVVGENWSNVLNRTFVKQVNFKSLKKIGSNSAKLTWKKQSNVDGYKIYRQTGNGKFKRIKTVSGSVLVFINTKLAKNKTYTYRIRAYKKIGSTLKYGVYSKTRKITVK